LQGLQIRKILVHQVKDSDRTGIFLFGLDADDKAVDMTFGQKVLQDIASISAARCKQNSTRGPKEQKNCRIRWFRAGPSQISYLIRCEISQDDQCFIIAVFSNDLRHIQQFIRGAVFL